MKTNEIVRADSSAPANILDDIQAIVETARANAYTAVNVALVQRNWLIGKRICEEELRGENRAGYGEEIIKSLSVSLTEIYGKGFDFSTLYKFVKFYKSFPDILDSVSPKLPLLTWTHYRTLIRVENGRARNWYLKEAAEQQWSVRTLDRNISSQYYERLLLSQNTKPVENEMKTLTKEFQNDKLEFIKNPVIAEFLGLSSNIDFTETQLESAIISNMQKFLMELGKGYAFVARQQHIRTEENDYFIDLVFYNYILKYCCPIKIFLREKNKG